jgi:WS/DGAT/MGAT family acyltransferase
MERLSGLDATFLYLETPTHHMHVAMTMVLDPSTMPGGYSFDKLKTFIRSRLHVVPLFHRRLAQVPFRLNHPVWVEDPDFDLDYHVRRIGVPSPGGRRELAEIAGQIASTQLDRTKPLWEMWVVEGLKQGRVGVITKVHHSAIDGASGADFLVHLFDLEPIAVESFGAPVDLPVEHLPNDLELLSFAAASLGRRTANMVPLLGRTVRSVARVIQGRRSPEKLVGAIPLSAPSTPWTASVTGHRSTAFSRVPLSELKRIKNTFGCTLNDVVLALVSGTLREYLDEKGALPQESLLAICPISVRNDESASSEPSANRVSGMFVSLGSNIDEIPDRIAHIRSSTKGAKEEHNAVGATMLMDWAEYASPNVFNMASRLYSNMGLANRHRAIHNVIISNVPGPNFPLYFAGAELVAAYPLGPVMEGCGLNITVFSYRDSVDVGFMACRELIPDVWDLAEATNRAMRDLSEAADREAARAARMLPDTKGDGATTATEAAAAPAPIKAKPAAKRTSAKQTSAKQTSAKQTSAKRAPAKRAAAKKAPTKKAPAKSTAAKRSRANKATAKASTTPRAGTRSRAS